MQIIATIRVGHIIQTATERFDVMGTSNLRGRYRYTVRKENGQLASLAREDVLQAQREGHTTVVAR